MWEEKKLKDATIKINSGKTPLGGESIYKSKGILFIRSQNVNNDRLDFNNPVYISDEINEGMQNSIVKSKDILLNITGASLGRSCVVPQGFTIGNVNQHVCIIRVNKETNPDFIQPIFSSINGQRLFDSLQTGSGREGLNFESIKNVKLFFPSLKEQTKIATFISLINERISTQNKIIEQLETLIKSLSEQIFKQQLRFENLNEKKFLKWERKKGNEIFENVSNKKHNSELPILAITQEHGAIPRNLIEYQISVSDKSVESYKVVEIGDFIISLRSFQGGIEYSKYKGICSPAYIILRNIINIDKRFYKYYFKTESYIRLLNKKLEGIRDGKMISYTYFSEVFLPYASLQEQERIANFLSHIDRKIEIEKKILDQYENQKKYLLSSLFI